MKKLFNLNYLLVPALIFLGVACSEDEINRNPIADFSFKVADDGRTVTFTNKSKDSETYAWNFGDGETSTEKSPVHVYEEAGEYDVTLVSTDGSKKDEFTQKVNVSGPDGETLQYNLSWAVGDGYSGPTLTFPEEDWELITAVLGMSKDEIIDGLDDGTVQVVAIEANGSINTTTTASGFGHWFDADGNVASWGDAGSRVYAEWHLGDNDNVAFGHRPDHPVAAGDEYTVTQALLTDDDKQFTFVFNIGITE